MVDASPTERKVLSLSMQNMNIESTATQLHMSPETVRSHRKHIIVKTGFQTIGALVAVLKKDMGMLEKKG